MFVSRIKNIIFSSAVILALSASISCAEHCNTGSQQKKSFSENPEARHEQLYKDLNVTEGQKKLLEENKSKHREQMKAMFNDIKEKRALVRQELQKDQLNMEKIRQINGELKSLQAQMLDYRLERILEVRKILTPEQFKKFISKIESRPGHFKN